MSRCRNLCYPSECLTHCSMVIFRKTAKSNGQHRSSLERNDGKVFETYMFWYVTLSRFWHILNWISNFSIKKLQNFQKFSILLHFWYTFSIKASQMRVFSENMKTTRGEKWKMANLGHFMEAKTSTCQIFVQYLKIEDFSAFMVLPEVKKWVKIYWNFAIFAELCQ